METIREIVDLSKKYGLEVYLDPWGVARIFGGEAYSKFLLLNDDARMVTRDGRLGYGACMNNPKTLDFLKKWIDAAKYAGADYVFWDEPHYSPLTNRDGCFCKICREKFRKQFKKDIEHADEFELKTFKGLTKLEFLKILTKYSAEKGLKNVLCLLPHDEDIDWENYASLEHLHVFATDPYWVLHPENFLDWMQSKVKLVSQLSKKYHKESEIWIQNFRVKKGEEDLILEVARVCKEYQIDRVSAWSFKGTFYMSYIRSEDPQKVWRTLLQAYSEMW